HRRLQGRMSVHKLAGPGAYGGDVHENPNELQALYQDILIHVTRFFRESASFDALKEHVLPTAVDNRPDDQPIRLWVCGCSTGEEAYSLAITVLEFLDEHAPHTPM